MNRYPVNEKWFRFRVWCPKCDHREVWEFRADRVPAEAPQCAQRSKETNLRCGFPVSIVDCKSFIRPRVLDN